MSYDVNKPADSQYIAQGPGDIRANTEALRTEAIVNAGTLNGLSNSNDAGQIPVSNGTVNTNLNADLLDGQHGSYYAAAAHTHAAVTTSSNGFMVSTDKAKLDGIAAGAQANQNAFGNVAVGSTTIQADSVTDTLTLTPGYGVTLTADAVNDAVTVAITNDGTNASHGHAAATAGAAGFISASDKSKLDGIAAGAEVNQMAFSTIVAGGVSAAADSKTDTFTFNAGAGITITGDAANHACSIAVTQDGHSHAAATAGAAGFMSTTDKSKLDGIAAAAEVNQMAFSNVLVGGTTIAADSKTDTLELAAGTNITLTPDATNDRVTIAVTGIVASATTATTAGNCTGNAATATKLATARTLSLTGDATGSLSFDGSANASTALTLAASGATAGTYTSVTVDAKGRVTAGTNPTTISASITGNAATATALQTARYINGVSFNGTADITIPSGQGVQGGFKNLKITNGSTANSQVAITADQIVLFNTSNLAYLASNVSVTINTGTSGVANGLDTGSVAANTWYSVWLIYNGTTVAGLLSTSATAPTLPSGYTYKARVGWVITDSNGYLMRTLQLGRKTQYVVTPSTNTTNLPKMGSSTTGNPLTPTYTAVSVSSYVPPTASAIKISAIGNGYNGQWLLVAPNNNYGVNSCPIAFSVSGGNAMQLCSTAELELESNYIYWAASFGNVSLLLCLGWEDNL